jgi:hypothetical protein
MIPRFARNDNGPGMASDGFLAMVS